MRRRPEPLQTTRLLGSGLFLWLIYAFVFVLSPTITNTHMSGLINALTTFCLYGGLVFLLTGMFLRATAWAQDWRDGTDAPYDAPNDVIVSERVDFPAEDDPDY